MQALLSRLCIVCCSSSLLFSFGCSSNETESKDAPGADAGAQHDTPGIAITNTGLRLVTSDFEIPAGKERFLCYATTLAQDTKIDAYQYTARKGIHHFVLATTHAPEPDGMSECNVLFRPTWSPLFIATTANAQLPLPQGAANVLPAGTQLLIQLHLLNAGKTAIKDHAVVDMERSDLPNPIRAGVYVFGSTDINLLPRQDGTVQSTCTTKREVKFFKMLPHMHYLGTSLKLEAGPDDNSLQTIFDEPKYDFNDQELRVFDMVLPNNSKTRTTCTYKNTRDQAVTFGESSLNEMCFAIGFALDVDGVSGCVQMSTKQYPHDPAAGQCADVVPNGLGIGKPCTKGGNECGSGLQCSADLQPGTPGMCMKLGCTSKADCGGDSASCCSFSGLASLCIPEACRPLTCAPQP